MEYFGEFLALGVSVSWSMSAIFFEFAGKRIGSVTVNLYKLLLTIVCIGLMLWACTGSVLPMYANAKAWWWLSLSGLIGFTICDLCLFYAYVTISSRFSQLIMTLYPPVAAFTSWILLDEKMPTMGYFGMAVTMFGVAISILKKDGNGKKLHIDLPTKGLVCALIGAVGQGVGLVFSKQGMIYYAQNPDITQEALDLLPFASTQIRAITGAIGFFLIILFSGRIPLVKSALQDAKAMALTVGGSMFGPIIGVSLSLLAIQNANTGIATTIMATTPIVILIPHMIIHKKRVSWIEIIGACISVVGVSLFFV